MEDIKVDVKGVEKLLRKIQPHKAQGLDNIPNMVLIECSYSLTLCIPIIFQNH